ncbi:MAG: TonB-dependent receptor plug domain-containing protein, partial [Campylobacterales bacterium]|nr:TonB-dependent receptor plug domain-containing protein [Campylobacterales bacterium]
MKKFVFLATFICCELYSTDDLINSLNEITKIATKTKLNVDYVPGLVSVVYGKDLKRAGITNLTAQNAFDVILGMESVVSSIRGVGSWYGANGNKIKWMINDIAIETELRETDDWAKGHVFLPISVDNIDRIEVIRGSASATYGGNAMFGVVNIITKKDITGGTVAFEQLGNGHYSKQISAFTNVKSDDFSLDLSISKLDSDGYNLYVGADGHFFSDFDGSRQWFGYGPGKLPLYLQGYSIMADLDYKDYKFWVYKFNTQTGQGYDWIPTDFFPPYNNDIYCKTSDILLVGMQKKYDLTENLSFTPKINYTQYSNPAHYLKYT